MKSPPAIAEANITVKEALHRMMAEKISSIFVRPNHRDGEGDGILTERDILRAIDDLGADVLKEPAGRFATRPLVSLDQEEFVYRAVRQMAAAGFRHPDNLAAYRRF